MGDKTLKDKAIKIKGKDYVQVKDRVLFFNENYENGSIITQLVSECTSEMVVVKAKVTPDLTNSSRYFTAYSQANWGDKTNFVNATAAMENAETSAVGRALALMGIGVIDNIASIDEINKSERQQVAHSKTTQKQADTNCEHKFFWINQVKKEDSPHHGKFFKSCKSCKKFLGWHEKEEDQDDLDVDEIERNLDS